MLTAGACPDRRAYEQLLAGAYPPEEQLEEVASHLEHCPRCAETVRELARGDTFTEGLARMAAPRPAGEEGAVAQLMERLGQLTPSPADGESDRAGSGGDPADDLGALLAPPQAEGEIGRLGPYRILDVIGRGGMGIVLRAEDPLLGRAVALKVMRPGLTASAEARRRFTAEARAMAAVEHDHITPVYHVGEQGGVPFFLMPLLRGESLETRLRRAGKLPVAEAVRIAREVAEGLAAAQAHGLIHRDVKPANVWLEGEPGASATGDRPSAIGGRVKLLDFGLARAVRAESHVTPSGTLLGTPAYMAPEQARGEAVDGRADLFSLGCMLYQMVTGQLPFRGTDAVSTLLAVTTEQPAPPRQLAPEVPPALNDLILRLLSKSLPERPASAQAVAWELGDLEPQPGSVPVPASAVAPSVATLVPIPTLAAGRPRPAARRGRWVAVAVAAALLALAGGTIAYQVIRVKDKDGQVVAEVKVPPGGSYEAVPADLPPLPVGEPLSPMALAPRPATLHGVRAWTIETARPRGAPRSAALNPDGSRLAVADGSSLRVYDAGTGRLEQVLLAPDPVWGYNLAWSPDGKRLAAGLASALQVWDVRTGRLVHTVRSAGPVFCVAWSPDGRTLAGGSDDGVQFWDAETGGPLPLRLPRGWFAWSPDGKTLAATDANGAEWVVSLWQWPSGKLLRTLPHPKPGICKPAWSPDGKTLLTGCEWEEKQYRLWDAATGKVIQTFADANSVRGPGAFSPDGKTLALAFDGYHCVVLRDVASGKYLWGTGPWTMANYPEVAWSQDGKTVVAKTLEEVVTIEAATGNVLRTFKPYASSIHGATWSADGKRVAMMSPLTIWDAQSGALLRDPGVGRGLGPTPASPVFSPDGTALAAAVPQGIRTYDAETGQLLREWPEQGALCVAWSPDGESLVSGGGDKTVRVRAAASGKVLRTLQGHEQSVSRVAWSPDGKVLASGDEQTIRLWDAASGKALRTLPGQGDFAVSWSPDGKSLASGGYSDSKTWVWEMASGEPRSGFPGRFLDWSADGRTALAVNDGLLQAWDVHSGRRLRSLPAPTSPTSPLGASPDHRTCASTAGEGAARLWQQESGRPSVTLVPLGDGAWFAVSPEGHYRGSPGVEKELVCVVQADKGQDVLPPEEFARRYGWKNDPNRVRVLPR